MASPETVIKLAKSWDDLRRQFVDFYYPPKTKDDNANKLREPLAAAAQKVYDRHVKGLNEFVKENGEKIKAHFRSLARYEAGLKTDPRTTFQKQRRWDEMQDLRKEAKGWIADLDARENALKAELLDLLRKERPAELAAAADAEKREKEADAKKAAEAAAKKTAKSETKKSAEPKTPAKTEKPAEAETKKPEPGPTPPKSPAADKPPESVKPKKSVEEKPADPPKDLSAGPAKAKPKSKETAESGAEESGDDESKAADSKPEQNKATGKDEKKDAKKADAAGAKPPTAEKAPAEKAADATDATILIDFSSLAKDRPASGPFAPSRNPLSWKPIEQLAFLLTWALFLIGLCLMLGLFTRPAALAGAGFMLFVVMSQPSYPFVYPPDPAQLGHALLVNKDFVEMIALLVIASTSLGRWTGLDFFIHRFLVQPFCKCCKCCSGTTKGEKA